MTRGLERVYRLDRFPEIVRYHLHRQTTFARSDLPARQAFDALLIAMFRRPGVWPAQMVELAEVQAALGSAEERLAFGRLVFPDSAPDKDVALAAVGEGGRHLVATTHTVDRTGARYTVRDPHDPAELGRLVQLLVRSGVPRAYSEGHRHLVALDAQERVVAGVSYSLLPGVGGTARRGRRHPGAPGPRPLVRSSQRPLRATARARRGRPDAASRLPRHPPGPRLAL